MVVILVGATGVNSGFPVPGRLRTGHEAENDPTSAHGVHLCVPDLREAAKVFGFDATNWLDAVIPWTGGKVAERRQ